MKKSFLILALLLSAVIAAPAKGHAFAAVVSTPEIYTTSGDIPAPLAKYLTQYGSRYEEQFLSNVLQPLRQTKSKNAIESSDIEKEREQSQRQTRNFTGEHVMRHDRDFDGKVSAAEIRETLLAVRHDRGWYDQNLDPDDTAQIKAETDATMKRYDTDKDGFITMKEAAEGGVPKARKRFDKRIKTQLTWLLELDPDKDGKLTAAELTAIAKKAFRAADTDGDGMLSAKESAKVREMGLSEPEYGEGCVAPAPAKSDRIVFVSAEKGGVASTLVGDDIQHRNMSVVRLEIEKGDTPLYIVASSRNSVIWQVTGDVGRVARLLLYSYVAYETDKMSAGAVGLAPERVSYLMQFEVKSGDGGYTPCLPQLSPYNGSRQVKQSQQQIDRAVVRILGRKPDVMEGFAQPFRIDVSGDKAVSPAIPEQEQPAPEGFDAETWKDFITLFPEGIAQLKKEDVVTELTLESRKLFPGLAGVAQLVKSGHLQREKDPRGAALVVVTGGGSQPVVVRTPDRPTVRQDQAVGRRQIRLLDDSVYRVLKPIDEYPLTYNDYLVRYLLGEGMVKPKNRQGCFVDETGEADYCR